MRDGETDIVICNLCGGRRGRLVISADGYDLVCCSSCGLVYVNHQFADGELARIYDEHYFNREKGHSYENYLGQFERRTQRAEEIIRGLRRYIGSGRLLEIGCAAGFFLHVARRYFDVRGVELSEYASDHARKELGLDVHTGTLASAHLENESLDVVVMWDVIEHLTDVRGTLDEIHRILRPGGVFGCTTGNIRSVSARRDLRNWHLLAPPFHLYYFDTRTLRQILSNAGFRTVCLRTDAALFGVMKKLMHSLPVRLLTSRLCMGDHMTVYAVKT